MARRSSWDRLRLAIGWVVTVVWVAAWTIRALPTVLPGFFPPPPPGQMDSFDRVNLIFAVVVVSLFGADGIKRGLDKLRQWAGGNGNGKDSDES